MKRFIGVVVFLFIISCEDDQLNLNQINIDPFLKENYLADCRELYVREILANPKHSNYSIPELDSNELNKIMAVFQLIYDLNLPERDTVFQYYSIHALKCNSLNSIVMKVNPYAPEIVNLIKGNIPTGNMNLDHILINYGFDSIETSYGYPKFPWLSVNTDHFYNLKPIIEAFEKLSSVTVAENNGGCFDGNNITLERDNNQTTVSFSIGRGDCPAGCIYRRTWIFQAINNEATFLKSY